VARPSVVAVAEERGVEAGPLGVAVGTIIEYVGVGDGAAGVLRATGLRSTVGEAATKDVPVGSGTTPMLLLEGMMTMSVKSNPAQKASSEPTTIPPIITASLALDIAYLKTLAAASTSTTMTARDTTAKSTDTKITQNLTSAG
jgi:hypothetical protein